MRAGRGDTLRHFTGIGVGPAVNVVVQIVELTDGREAGLQHFHIGEGGDRLDVIGRKALKEVVHHLAPGPEAVGGRAAALGEPGHAALEGVAVQVGQAGNGDAGNAISPGTRRALRDGDGGAVGDRDADVARPSGRQQSLVEKELALQIRSPPRRAGTWHYCSTIGGAAALCIEDRLCEDAMRFDTIWLDARLATLSPDHGGLGVVERGAVATAAGRIAFAGPMAELPAGWDASNRVAWTAAGSRPA